MTAPRDDRSSVAAPGTGVAVPRTGVAVPGTGVAAPGGGSAVRLTAAESAAMLRAVELAARGAATVLPNPVVGCLILGADDSIVGEGYHQRAGDAHAEVRALEQAGAAARGGTAVVTLEPCNHVGRTGPCTVALLAAGIARAVVAVHDPSPEAAGGIRTLRAAGVDVVDLSAEPVVTEPVAAAEAEGAELVRAAEQVNRIWLTAVRNRRPYVTWKAGMTLDGRVAAPDGTSKWITSAQSRADAQLLRARVDTMMVGVGTVLADDPWLTARNADGYPAERQPLRVIVDSKGRTPSEAKVFDDTAPTLLATAEEFGGGPDGRVDLQRLLMALFERDRRHVLLEGGPRLAASMLDAGLVDEVIVYVAPVLLGAGTPALAHGAARTLSDAHRFRLAGTRRLGDDVRLTYYSVPGRSRRTPHGLKPT